MGIFYIFKKKRKAQLIMKKVIAVILASVFCLAPLAGCAPDPVKVDLTNYLNIEILAIKVQHDADITAYTAAINDKEATLETLATAFEQTVIPAGQAHLAAVQAIAPVTEDIIALHTLYIKSLTTRLEGYQLILEAAKADDDAILASANAKITEAGEIEADYDAQLAVLKDKFGIKDAE